MSVAYGCPPKVIRLNSGNKTSKYITNLVNKKIEIVQEFLEDDDTCYLEIE